MSKYFKLKNDIKAFKQSKSLSNSILPSASILGKSVLNVGIFAVSEIAIPLISQSIEGSAKQAKSTLKSKDSTEEQKAKAHETLDREKKIRNYLNKAQENLNKDRG